MLKPFLYSQSDFVKKVVAIKIKALCTYNLMCQIISAKEEQADQAHESDSDDAVQYLNKPLFSVDIRTVMADAEQDVYGLAQN